VTEHVGTSEQYTKAMFSGRPGSIAAFFETALQTVHQAASIRSPGARRLQVLDLGCGTGDLVMAMVGRLQQDPGHMVLPHEITGLDVSGPNIAVAVARAASLSAAVRPVFVAADYSEWSGSRFDVILTDGVLHLIPGDSGRLARKLATDLAPGGLLLVSMADGSATNQLLTLQRRCWRTLPLAADRLAEAAARRLYPQEPAHIIAERLGYLRVLPERGLCAAFTVEMAEAGLVLRWSRPWPGPSVFKLRHRLALFSRTDAAGTAA
jgi:trans-aconitate 2-methyltransferase